ALLMPSLWNFGNFSKFGAWPGDCNLARDQTSRGTAVPHVASKASVLQSQQSGLSRRERAAEANEAASPFSTLLAETGSPPPPARYHASRPSGSTPTQRNDASRNPTHRTDAQRPQQSKNDSAGDAPETTEVPEDAAIDSFARAAEAEPVA